MIDGDWAVRGVRRGEDSVLVRWVTWLTQCIELRWAAPNHKVNHKTKYVVPRSGDLSQIPFSKTARREAVMRIHGAVAMLILVAVTGGCATGGARPIRTLSVLHSFPEEPVVTQTKSDVEIELETIDWTSEMSDYPEMFSFDIDEFPQYRGDRAGLNALFSLSGGRRWVYPFFDDDARRSQLLIARTTVTNGTSHTLRLTDAQMILATEDGRDISPVASWNKLLRYADIYEQRMNQYLARPRGSGIRLRLTAPRTVPLGFYRAFLAARQNAWRLLNLDRGILPGRSATGVIVFQLPPGQGVRTANISFFDVTVKADAAGNPTEKTQFHFPVTMEWTSYWFDPSERSWKKGRPPVPAKPADSTLTHP